MTKINFHHSHAELLKPLFGPNLQPDVDFSEIIIYEADNTLVCSHGSKENNTNWNVHLKLPPDAARPYTRFHLSAPCAYDGYQQADAAANYEYPDSIYIDVNESVVIIRKNWTHKDSYAQEEILIHRRDLENATRKEPQ